MFSLMLLMQLMIIVKILMYKHRNGDYSRALPIASYYYKNPNICRFQQLFNTQKRSEFINLSKSIKIVSVRVCSPGYSMDNLIF